MKKTILALLCLGAVEVSNAEIIKVNGEGTASIIKKDPNGTRNQAFNNAKTDAVIALIKRINGPQAMNEASQYLNALYTTKIDNSLK